MDPHVSRETPSAPASARGAFPSARLPLAERYAELLATEGVVRGLIGPREAPRLWERHLLNCAVVAELVPAEARVCDVGTGAGLPGVVLAIARPDLRVTLVEPLLRRTTFLEDVVAELGLEARVHRGRAESLHGVESFDVVTSRAVAPLGRLLEWSLPLMAPTGQVLAMKGSSAEAEIVEAADEVARWGCAPATVHVVGGGVVEPPTSVVRVVWSDPGRVSWPLVPSPSGTPVRGRRRTVTAKRRRRT